MFGKRPGRLCTLHLLPVVKGLVKIMCDIVTYSANESPSGIYLLKVNDKNTRAKCEICSKLTIDVVLVYLLLNLNIFHTLF